MLKPLAENFDTDIEVVEDVIKALMDMPKAFTVHPLGQKCVMGIDYVHECVFLDDPNCIGEYTYDVIEEAKENGEPTEIDVPEEKLQTYKPEVYVLMGYSDVCQNGNCEARLIGVFSKKELAESKGKELVSSGDVEYYEVECPVIDECV